MGLRSGWRVGIRSGLRSGVSARRARRAARASCPRARTTSGDGPRLKSQRRRPQSASVHLEHAIVSCLGDRAVLETGAPLRWHRVHDFQCFVAFARHRRGADCPRVLAIACERFAFRRCYGFTSVLATLNVAEVAECHGLVHRLVPSLVLIPQASTEGLQVIIYPPTATDTGKPPPKERLSRSASRTRAMVCSAGRRIRLCNPIVSTRRCVTTPRQTLR